MKKIVWFSNLMFYCTYQFEILSFKKNTPKEIQESLWKNPKTGASILRTRSHFMLLEFSVELILLFVIQVLLQKNLIDYVLDDPQIYKVIVTAFIFVTPTMAFEYYVIFKNKRYLKFFQQFDQIPRSSIKIYMILFLLIYASVIILGIGSFTWFRNYVIFPH